MPRRYWLVCTVLALFAGAALGSCSGKKSTAPASEEPAETTDTTLTWVGTDVVYRDVAGKHDHSIIFVLAEWCGWCQRLKRETLTDSTVIHMLNESFNCVHLNPDADSMVAYQDSMVTCHDLASRIYGVNGYPTMLFFKGNGDFIGPAPGYKNVENFRALLDTVKARYP